MRDPLGRGAGRRLLEHAVDLLEGQALGLGDEEIRVDEAGGAERAPDVEDLGAEVALVLVDHVRRDDGDDAVPEPVAGGREGDAAGAHGQGVDLADYDPGSAVGVVSIRGEESGEGKGKKLTGPRC